MAGSDTSREDSELEDAKEAFARAKDAWSENYELAIEDFRFARLGEQWPEKIRKQREEDVRPCLTINKLAPMIRQVVNDARQNKPAIAVHPADDAADPETAEVFNGLIRNIERNSDADVAYDTAIDHSATGGFGFFKINTRYARDDGFEQDIVIEACPNAFAICPDPDSTAADSSDWNSAWELEGLTKRQFERRFAGAEAVSFDGTGLGSKSAAGGDLVQIAYEWVREETVREIVALSPLPLGLEGDLAEMAARAGALMGESLVVDVDIFEKNRDLFAALGVTVIGEPRGVPSYKVEQRIWSGAERLKTIKWAGKFIPIVPVYGEDLNIEGRRHLAGMVRAARDAQQMFNFWRTASTELVALAPKTPFIGPVGAFTTDAAKWATANTQSHAYIEFDTVDADGNPISLPPQRQPFSGVPAGALQEALNASDDIKSILGMYDASLGARSNETSGRAIMARQREGDVSTFNYIDNLSRAIRHAGRILLDLIPKVYSTPRMQRILGPDDSVYTVRIAPKDQREAEMQRLQGQEAPQEPSEAKPNKFAGVYALDAGKYDLTVTAGPSFTSRREEAATQMIELIRAYPAVAPIIGDLLAKNLDWPGADEIAERLRSMLPAQLQGENPEAEAAKAQMQKMAQIIGQLRGELEAARADKSIDFRKVEIDAYEAETGRLNAITGKDGAGFDPVQMAPVVAASLAQIFQSPDILQLAMSGADPRQIMAAMQQRQPAPAEAA